jgi:hypothetical protein
MSWRETGASSGVTCLSFGAARPQAQDPDSGSGKSGQRGMNFSHSAIKGGEGSVGIFIVFVERLRFELLSEVVGVVGAEYSQGSKQRMRGAGDVAGAAARDGATNIVEKPRRVFVKQPD